jgi:asparagine synthase (glutamine-hydrolysing)
MSDILAHRGPDDKGTWVDGNVGLGHRMLWTTPESLHEHLPLNEKTSGLAITADARIDNREELYALLEIGKPLLEISDSELILAAYAKWGEQCPGKLVGDFAFAIWDGRNQKLFCARDCFGVKSFYYHLSDEKLAFATEIKGVLTLTTLPRRLNELKVADYLLAGALQDKEITFYEGILRLPPAHCLTVSKTGKRLRCYWSLDPTRELCLASDAEYAEQLRELFTEAVRCRMRSAFPMGSMLSGGLDSSSITCVARKLISQGGGNQQWHTFSAVFDKVKQCDERFFINAVLAGNSIKPHYAHADEMSPLKDLERVLWHHDEAMRAGNLYYGWDLHSQAKQHGVRILLDGFDGDSTISHGTGLLTELARKGKWIDLALELKEFAPHVNDSHWTIIWWSWLRKFKVDPLMSRYKATRRLRSTYRSINRRISIEKKTYNRAGYQDFLNPDFVKRIGVLERRKAVRRTLHTERDFHYDRLMHAGMTNVLETLDKAAGAFSIELRFPFWDKRLAEYCLALPPEQKLHKGWERMVMRRAMDGILPEEVRWRGAKTDMTPSFEHGLLSFERDRMNTILLKKSGVIEKYIDTDALSEACHRFNSLRATREEVQAVWNALSLALWLQHADLTC